jgi:hypothetical protein
MPDNNTAMTHTQAARIRQMSTRYAIAQDALDERPMAVAEFALRYYEGAGRLCFPERTRWDRFTRDIGTPGREIAPCVQTLGADVLAGRTPTPETMEAARDIARRTATSYAGAPENVSRADAVWLLIGCAGGWTPYVMAYHLNKLRW